MEKKLQLLYGLQLVDSALDELDEQKGDLPSEKLALEETIARLEATRASHEKAMRDALDGREADDNQILALREKLQRYKAQQLEVRNNREYDALTREIDHATDAISRLEKEMETLEGLAMRNKADMATLADQIEESRKVLVEKDEALTEISKMNEEEELKYRHEREKLLTRIDATHLNAYERIRKAKKGRAIVPVRRNACGGCFAKIPPQHLLELRQNDKLYYCEHCGRIIVSDEIVGATSLAV